MGEQFTDSARESIVLAQREAEAMGQVAIGSEHLLLGVLAEGASPAAQKFVEFGLTLEKVRCEVIQVHGTGPKAAEPGFSPLAKRVVELAFSEARAVGLDCVGTEHLLLALLGLQEGVASRVL
ncbi:unnamed protein product, partial [Phaeothamnion confervicola]